ncbi:uncharacterized protein V6R79_005111 [Siganus canaliculatus]
MSAERPPDYIHPVGFPPAVALKALVDLPGQICSLDPLSVTCVEVFKPNQTGSVYDGTAEVTGGGALNDRPTELELELEVDISGLRSLSQAEQIYNTADVRCAASIKRHEADFSPAPLHEAMQRDCNVDLRPQQETIQPFTSLRTASIYHASAGSLIYDDMSLKLFERGRLWFHSSKRGLCEFARPTSLVGVEDRCCASLRCVCQ